MSKVFVAFNAQRIYPYVLLFVFYDTYILKLCVTYGRSKFDIFC
jgi:hypothetical protein